MDLFASAMAGCVLYLLLGVACVVLLLTTRSNELNAEHVYEPVKRNRVNRAEQPEQLEELRPSTLLQTTQITAAG